MLGGGDDREAKKIFEGIRNGRVRCRDRVSSLLCLLSSILSTDNIMF